jgi:hypothetical protein
MIALVACLTRLAKLATGQQRSGGRRRSRFRRVRSRPGRGSRVVSDSAPSIGLGSSSRYAATVDAIWLIRDYLRCGNVVIAAPHVALPDQERHLVRSRAGGCQRIPLARHRVDAAPRSAGNQYRLPRLAETAPCHLRYAARENLGVVVMGKSHAAVTWRYGPKFFGFGSLVFSDWAKMTINNARARRWPWQLRSKFRFDHSSCRELLAFAYAIERFTNRP